MQLIPIVIVAVVLMADVLNPREMTIMDRLLALVVAVGPVLLLVLAAQLGVVWTRRRIAARAGIRPLIWLDRGLQLSRLLLLATHAVAVFGFGWLQAVRGVVGNSVLIDELVAMLPPLLGMVALWWVHYPIERQLRESLIIRRLDLGQPIHQVPKRGAFVLQQARHHLLLVFVPLLLILILSESLNLLLPRVDEALRQMLERDQREAVLPPWVRDVSTLAAALLVLLFAPLLARLVLEVKSLPAGEVRDDLQDICRRHRVKARDLLLWKTDGTLINAAVMGLVAPLRYVMLTDALIETLDRPQLQAVMAHEIGHVRRRHMPWLVASLLALLLALPFLIGLPLWLARVIGVPDASMLYDAMEIAALVIAGLVLLAGFGWMSRRYERQADTFAVQHLSGLGLPAAAGSPAPQRITAEAVSAMLAALETIAQLNTVDRRRRSWRHGSIASRQAYLLSLVGHPVHRLPIDRTIGRLKVSAAVLLIVAVSGAIAVEWLAAAHKGTASPRSQEERR